MEAPVLVFGGILMIAGVLIVLTGWTEIDLPGRSVKIQNIPLLVAGCTLFLSGSVFSAIALLKDALINELEIRAKNLKHEGSVFKVPELPTRPSRTPTINDTANPAEINVRTHRELPEAVRQALEFAKSRGWTVEVTDRWFALKRGTFTITSYSEDNFLSDVECYVKGTSN